MMHAEEADRARESAEWVREGVLTYLRWWSAELEVKSSGRKGLTRKSEARATAYPAIYDQQSGI